jgi:hypothetical protein
MVWQSHVIAEQYLRPDKRESVPFTFLMSGDEAFLHILFFLYRKPARNFVPAFLGRYGVINRVFDTLPQAIIRFPSIRDMRR